MKKLLCLGGNYFQMTAVKAAKRLGYYVIDADYSPQNPAHKYADEYYNISTLDKEGILKLASDQKVDGVLSYASDVSAPIAAYVAEKLGLPTNPYESVVLMTRKDMFHPFLKKNGFYVPESIQVHSIKDIYNFFDQVGGDIILKPVSSSGSKGVSRITDPAQIEKAFEEAQKYARGDILVAEKYIQRKNYQIAGDAFLVDGKIKFFGLANEHFNDKCSPLVPVGESFPVSLEEQKIAEAKKKIERVLSLLKMRNGAINLDFMFDAEDKLLIIELGPRNGGNLITDAIKESTGVDLAEYTVKAAVGEDLSGLEECAWRKNISSYIWHSEVDGNYREIQFSNELKRKLIVSDMFIKQGSNIKKFINGGFGLGAALIQYDSKDEMLYMMDHMNDYYKILLE